MARVTRAQQQRVRRWVDKYQSSLLLTAWTVLIEHPQKPFEGDAESGETTYANCQPSLNYVTAYFNVFPAFWGLSREEQERTVIHELLHSLTEPSKQLALAKKRPSEDQVEQVNEQLTETIANIVWKYEQHHRRKKKSTA